MESMGERKILNKYFSPDFDPSMLPRRTQPKKQQTRMMILPMSIRCNTCANYIYKGTKFDSRKEAVIGETYLGIQVFRLYLKCTNCSAELTIKSDPQNSEYVVESGATRYLEPWRVDDARRATMKWVVAILMDVMRERFEFGLGISGLSNYNRKERQGRCPSEWVGPVTDEGSTVQSLLIISDIVPKPVLDNPRLDGVIMRANLSEASRKGIPDSFNARTFQNDMFSIFWFGVTYVACYGFHGYDFLEFDFGREQVVEAFPKKELYSRWLRS
ncbi:CWC16 protein [Macleaya cordata]|uniref:CWC16 protein n=1 Tax=Macleaya cordata TaxID=56857 RepID=A0A200QIT7_MACCD|nr:CWC16 protein [Macleaya cordata]